MLHICFPYSPQDPEKYCIFILREEYIIPVGIFRVYLPQIIVRMPLPKIRCYLSPSHTISSILAYLSFRNYNPQFVFTVLLGILSVCFIVIAFCVGMMSKRRRKQRVCAPIYCENTFCPQDGKEYSSMSAFTQHIGRSVSCQQFVQSHLVGTVSLLCMTSDNAEASSVVINNRKPSVLRHKMVNRTALFPNSDNKIGFSHAAACSLPPCDDEDALFDSKGDGFDATTFTFQPPEECAVLTSSGFMYTTKQNWTVALLKLMDDINAPDYAFHLIIDWACSAKNNGYSFLTPCGLTQNANVDLLFKSLPNAFILCPSFQPVKCVDGSSSNVIAFDFVPQLLCLLQNPSVMTPENLAINFSDPLLRYENPGNVLGEAMSPTLLASFLFPLSNGWIGLL